MLNRELVVHHSSTLQLQCKDFKAGIQTAGDCHKAGGGYCGFEMSCETNNSEAAYAYLVYKVVYRARYYL